MRIFRKRNMKKKQIFSHKLKGRRIRKVDIFRVINCVLFSLHFDKLHNHTQNIQNPHRHFISIVPHWFYMFQFHYSKPENLDCK